MTSYTLQSSPDSYSVKRQTIIIDELNMSLFFFNVAQMTCYLLCGAVYWLFRFSGCSASGVAIQLFHSEKKCTSWHLLSSALVLH